MGRLCTCCQESKRETANVILKTFNYYYRLIILQLLVKKLFIYKRINFIKIAIANTK